jgi:hypothetical protein
MTTGRHAQWQRDLLVAGAVACISLGWASASQAEVGVAAAVNIDAQGKPPGGAPRVISLGQKLIFNEEVTTDASGLVQILLLDGTTFTVGPNSKLTIDKFVYDPETGDAEVVASIAKGTFRFIGGQTSRKDGGARINTPVGTIGIRGAMVEGNVQSSNAALFSMIFGDNVQFQASNGEKAKIFKPGYTLVVQAGENGDVSTDVRPRTADDASTFLTALAGKPKTSGGSKNKPGDDTVAGSGVGGVNSNLPYSVPIPTFRSTAVQSTKLDDVEDNLGEFDVAQQPIVVLPDNPPPPPPRPPTPQLRTGRLLTAPDVYNASFGGSFPQAGSRGLVGSTPGTDQELTYFSQNGRLYTNGVIGDVPDITGAQGDSGGLQLVNIVDGHSSVGTLAGPAYAGAGDFAAYLLGVNGDPTDPVYFITGTATPDSTIVSMLSGTQVREYVLTPDPIQQSPVPFFSEDLFGSFTRYNSTNFYITESDTLALHGNDRSEDFDTKAFQSWIIIEGDGLGQKSAIGVTVATLDPMSGAMFTGRRGSFRYDSDAGPVNMRGALDTIPGPDGYLFGPNANHFFLGTPPDPADAYTDALLGPGFTGNPNDGYLGDGAFSTHHVAGLVSTTPQSSLSRTARFVTGFMTGVGESSIEGINNPYALTSEGTTNFTMNLDPTFNVVQAQATLFETLDVNVVGAYLLTFGPTGPTVGGDSAFITDDIFGAHRNQDNDNTRLITDSSTSLPNKAGDNPGSYLVSGRANPIAGYQHCTECDFIDWGWWGTRVRVDASGTEIPSERTDYVHMGTWVAGQLTDPTDLPTSGIVNYSGTALGTMTRDVAGSVHKYIASGTMDMSFDFYSRSGQVDIGNFDGVTTSANVSQPSLTQNFVTGNFAGGGVIGTVDAAFVDAGTAKAAGVVGGFHFEGAGFNAVGTIAGVDSTLSH